MPNDDIQGTVTDANGNTVGGAIVALWNQDNPSNVVTTTADSNGNYIFTGHPDADGTSTNWHVAARDPNDGTRQFPSLHSISAQITHPVPDSSDLQARYDARELSLSDGDSISIWSDETANGYDLIGGSPVYRSSALNGMAAVEFDGVDDILSTAFGSTEGQPNHIFIVAEYRSTSGANETLFDGDTTRETISNSGGGDYGYYAGNNFSSSGITAPDVYIFNVLFNGASSVLRLNGTIESGGDSGSQGLDGVTLGNRAGGGEPAPVNVGEVLVYPQDKSGSQADIEGYLASKWGIPL